ncbi:hypothetical protein [Pedobacter metabolipauper]|uniref:Uncharacterized protein n=1 Tax=Pedobacter metabolipauper TaxID=425513 RepID=A0A4R6SV79_9SPHI|nr:hypothetical protein [Pedobacter metabolipauper]TDQ08261.1 hypothetical protein ATK78_2769 [Pedobacter metabolipauper]
MQGINKARHLHLVDALLQLEDLIAGLEMSPEPYAELKSKRLELEDSYRVYLNILDRLAFHIATYEDLFMEVKVQYAVNHFKELKKQVQPKSLAAEKLKESIVLACST